MLLRDASDGLAALERLTRPALPSFVSRSGTSVLWVRLGDAYGSLKPRVERPLRTSWSPGAVGADGGGKTDANGGRCRPRSAHPRSPLVAFTMPNAVFLSGCRRCAGVISCGRCAVCRRRRHRGMKRKRAGGVSQPRHIFPGLRDRESACGSAQDMPWSIASQRRSGRLCDYIYEQSAKVRALTLDVR